MAQALNALGYREILEHLDRGAALSGPEAEATIARIALATRQFVRRQRAWFRPEPGTDVAHPERDRERVRRHLAEVMELRS